MNELKSVLKSVLFGRPNGFRSKIRSRWGESPPVDPPTAPVTRPAPLSKAPPGFARAIEASALPPGEVAEVLIGEEHFAICNVGGQFFATSNICPHAGGPMGTGTLSEYTLTCPYHGWAFDVREGGCSVSADVKLPVYPTQVIDGVVYIAKS